METLVIALHVFVCLFLIVVVLLQPGKGGDMGSSFSASLTGGQNVFAARGALSVLGKITTVSAVIFMCTSMLLATMSGTETASSLLKDATAPAPAAVPAAAVSSDAAPQAAPVEPPVTPAPATTAPSGDTAPVTP